jgi:cell division protease FtsH
MFFYPLKYLFFLSFFAVNTRGIKITTEKLLKDNYLFGARSYNNLIERIDTHKVSKIYISPFLNEVLSENDEFTGNEYVDYSLTKVSPLVVNSLTEEAVKNKVETIFLQAPQPNLFQQLSSELNYVTGFVGPLFFLLFLSSIVRSVFFNGGQSGMPNMGNMGNFPGTLGGNRLNKDKKTIEKFNITLSSFAGSQEIFEECTEVVSYLKNSTIYKLAGAEIPKGILLEGSPGTGKTLLAKAIASEADANFISIAASEFVEIFVGVGASKIRDLFKTARENKPCILFIDEIDAVGRQRGAGINMGNDEREQTLNQLLAEMDGFGDNEGILVMAATNRKDVLDSALLRPGRFDRVITVALPDRESRKEILKVHSKNKQMDETIQFDMVAEATAGFSGAQLKNLMNEAAIYAVREGKTQISEKNIFDALEKLLVGILKKVDTRSDDAKKRVAIHEMGHAILAAYFSEYFDLKKATIQSTYNGAGGFTVFSEYQNVTESGLYTKDMLYKRLVVSMGGKAAESIMYGDQYVSVGAVQDLKQANSLAQTMIGSYGMGEQLEVFYNENVDGQRTPFLGRSLGAGDRYSDSTMKIFDNECLRLLDNAYTDAKNILTDKSSVMDELVDRLLEKTTLTGKEIVEKVNE